jgi:two-component system CheB/CheR fusion protein
VAVSFAEYAELAGRQVGLQIFATDLNGAGVEKARGGIYPKAIAQDVSPERLRRFFVDIDGFYRISKEIRDACIFARHNALTDPPFSRIDLITCRNLLIYLEPVLQQRMLPTLHYALRPNGFLWVGGSETIGAYRALFELVDPRHKIYSKKASAAHLGPALPLEVGDRHTASARAGAVRELGPAHVDMQREADRILLTRYAPPGVLINADFDILQFRGDTGAYLALAPGRASLNLLKMLREGLLVSVRAALYRAKKDETPVIEEGLRVKSNGGYRDVNVRVVPIKGASAREGCILVLFEEAGASEAPRSSAAASAPVVGAEARPGPALPGESPDGHVGRLTQELSATREYLQSVIAAGGRQLRSCNRPTRKCNRPTRSCKASTRSWKLPRRRSSRATKSWPPSTRSSRTATWSCPRSTTTS